MKKLLTILGLFISLIVSAQTSINPTLLSTSTDRSRPSHTRWNNQGGGEALSGVPADKLFYRRYSWRDLQNNAAGSWRFNERLRPDVEAAVNAGAMFNMGIMNLYPDGSNSFNETFTVAGRSLTYPPYIHDDMQASGTPDMDDGFCFIPNYNNELFLDEYEALHIALRNWWDTASYTPSTGPRAGQLVYFRNVLAIFDVRGWGTYGEFHHANVNAPYNNIGSWPAGRFPTEATFKRLIDMQVDAFDDYPCTFIINGLDGETFGHTMIPMEIGWYLMTKTNNAGPLSIRRDNWGDAGTYYWNISIYRTTVHNGLRFDTACQNRWKYGPNTGEPINDIATNGNCGALPQQFRDLHTYGMGNGNYSGTLPSGACADSVRAAFRIQGSWININSGSMTTTLTQNASFNVTLNYQNLGLTPEYWKWKTTYELRNQTTDAVVATFTSAFTPKGFLPAGSATAYNENFNLGNVPTGTYRLVVKIIDTTNYREPFPLGITGRESDGAYQLRNNITVQAGGNQAPNADAGNDVTVQLPTSTTNLSGSGSTDDVLIASYAWSQISGPNSATIGSPNSMNTSVSNLVAGTYVFRLTVQDGDASPLSDTDDVTVTVLAATSPVIRMRKHGKLILQ